MKTSEKSKLPGQENLQTFLEGLRALDLTDEKGLLCGKVLGDLGVDVIKIEKPGGDPIRNRGPFYQDIPEPCKSLFWFSFNANKRGITLNIETMDGRGILKKLIKSSDFLIESFPPG
jgi:crotonobetainyl-CoA:carnitine CoA-transferase CaiB-like acyl-CoA transferase